MTVKHQPDEVRAIVARTFEQHGAVARRASEVVESALFDNGRCVAWSYRLAGLMAMWFVDIGIVQFYDVDGNMLQTLSLVEPPQSQRMAA
jgi:hypothetical protein